MLFIYIFFCFRSFFSLCCRIQFAHFMFTKRTVYFRFVILSPLAEFKVAFDLSDCHKENIHHFDGVMFIFFWTTFFIKHAPKRKRRKKAPNIECCMRRAVFDVFKFQSLINKTETKQDEKEGSESESKRGREIKSKQRVYINPVGAAECGNAYEMPYLNKQT